MISGTVTGNEQMAFLLKEQANPVFNYWEKRFIRDLKGKTYESLSKTDRGTVYRLYGWLISFPTKSQPFK